MINPRELFHILIENDFRFITGVPCSIFNGFLRIVEKEKKKIEHIIAVDEGEAIGIAAGYYLATSKVPIVYMQNSGLGNALDALTSLSAKEVYNIPVLLLISWRGEPGKNDEPQHEKMGKITIKLLKTLEIPHIILSSNKKKIKQEITKVKQYFQKKNLPYSVIIRKEVLKPYSFGRKEEKSVYSLKREEAIKIILDNLKGDEVIISATGKISRELFEYQKKRKQSTQTNFYVIGSMGCASSIGLGIILKKPKRKIFIFDGDGSILMKMGSLATIGHYSPKNFCHIIFDNNAYDSTGGQSTISDTLDFVEIAKASGYKTAKLITTREKLKRSIVNIRNDMRGPILLVVKVKKGCRADLGRLPRDVVERKKIFMDFL